jgi:hypothetical protein
LLNQHLDRCSDCDTFAVEAAKITQSLRTAPHEQPSAPLVVASRRSSGRPAAVLAFAAAAAAAAFAASALQSGSSPSVAAAAQRPAGLALIASGESTLGVRHLPTRQAVPLVAFVRGAFGQPI